MKRNETQGGKARARDISNKKKSKSSYPTSQETAKLLLQKTQKAKQ
jgi:hypothetical protein